MICLRNCAMITPTGRPQAGAAGRPMLVHITMHDNRASTVCEQTANCRASHSSSACSLAAVPHVYSQKHAVCTFAAIGSCSSTRVHVHVNAFSVRVHIRRHSLIVAPAFFVRVYA